MNLWNLCRSLLTKSPLIQQVYSSVTYYRISANIYSIQVIHIPELKWGLALATGEKKVQAKANLILKSIH